MIILNAIFDIGKGLLIPVLGLIILNYLDKKLPRVSLLFGPSLIFICCSAFFTFTSTKAINFFGSEFALKFAICTFCMMFLLVYIIYILEKIRDSTSDSKASAFALLEIGFAAFAVIVFFTTIYVIYYRLFPNSFIGSIGNDMITQIVSFFYFSVISFATVGYGDIVPLEKIPRILVTTEVIYAFITVIYAISSFSHIKQALKD